MTTSSGFSSRAGGAGRRIHQVRRRSHARAASPHLQREYKLAYLTADLPCSVDHGIIGLMDPAPRAIRSSGLVVRSRSSIHEKQKNFEPIPDGFRMKRAHPQLEQRAVQVAGLYADANPSLPL